MVRKSNLIKYLNTSKLADLKVQPLWPEARGTARKDFS